MHPSEQLPIVIMITYLIAFRPDDYKDVFFFAKKGLTYYELKSIMKMTERNQRNLRRCNETMKFTLTDLRNRKNISQRRLAEKLSKSGVRFTQPTIAAYELGIRTPSLKRAKIIAQYFGVPVEDIIFGSYDCDMKSSTKETGSSARTQAG